MEKELELLEELLTERETLLKIGEGRLSEDSLKKTAEEIESLCRIARIVRKEENALTEENRRTLASLVERILNDSASAHVEKDAAGRISLTVYDRINRPKVLAKLDMEILFGCLVIRRIHFYEEAYSCKCDRTESCS